MNQIKKVMIKGSDMDKLYEAFDKMEHSPEDYTPSIKELKKMVLELPKYAIFLMWLNESGERTNENEQQHDIIEHIIRNYIVIDYAN